MLSTVLHMFLWWWPEIPIVVRYVICGALAVGVVIGWIFQSSIWPLWLFALLIIGCMAVYGEPTDAEKKGYRF